MDVSLLGVPFNGIGTPPETENPAQAIRDAGLIPRLTDRGHRVTDLGDVPVPPFSHQRDPATGVLNQDAWREMTEAVAVAVRNRLDPARPIVLLGGDCAVMSGVVVAAPAGMGIVYVDGHADYRMPADSPTGEPADLVLTALTGKIPGLFGDAFPVVREDAIVVAGLREPDRIAESAIVTFDRPRLRRMGITGATREMLQAFTRRAGPVWVHCDVDVLDPAVMPAVVFPEPDGLSAGEVETLLTATFRMLPVLGMSIACYHPRLDPDGSGAQLIVGLVSAALPG